MQVSKEFFAALPDLRSQRCVAEALLDVLQTRTDSDVATLVRKTFKHVSGPLAILVSLAILVVIIIIIFSCV